MIALNRMLEIEKEVRLYGEFFNRVDIEDLEGLGFFSDIEINYYDIQYNFQYINGVLVRALIDAKKAYVKRGYAKYFK
jgi:adenylate cyclase class IV